MCDPREGINSHAHPTEGILAELRSHPHPDSDRHRESLVALACARPLFVVGVLSAQNHVSPAASRRSVGGSDSPQAFCIFSGFNEIVSFAVNYMLENLGRNILAVIRFWYS